jgi:hypothetical protein
MYSVFNCHSVATYTTVLAGIVKVQYDFTGNAGCFKKNFTMVFQMLLCGECTPLSGNVFVTLSAK